MALLWCDGFDHYGTDISNLTQGVYADLVGGGLLTAVNPRTGARSLDFGGSVFLRRALGGPKTTVGIGGAFNINSLPATQNSSRVFDFRDASNGVQVTLVLQPTGVITVKRGTKESGTVLGESASPVITPGAYNHVEVVVFFDNSAGSVELRVDGVTVVSVTGVDTVNTSNAECSQIGMLGGPASYRGHLDDIFCYDDTGSFNNTFLGDRRVHTLFPDADTAQADWTVVGSASGFGAINEDDPDGDTTYISAGVPGSPTPTSEFGMDDLPAGVSAVSAVVLVNNSIKTEAGDGSVQMSVISGASETAGADNPLTLAYTYRQDVIEVDPATAAPFTASAVDDLLIKADRTA